MSRPAAAFFDVDGTIVDATIVHYYAALRTHGRSAAARLLWQVGFLPWIPYYWLLDQFSRELFNRRFYYNYRGFSASRFPSRAERLFEEFIRPRISPGARRKIEEHQSRDEAVVLISGSLRPILEPLGRDLRVTEIVAPAPEVADGVLTGRLAGPPLTGRRKAEAAARCAQQQGVSLSDCYGYADSADDQALLEAVGRPIAVNPDRGLRAAARRGGWEVLSWRRSSI